jgi:hypothetical protein
MNQTFLTWLSSSCSLIAQKTSKKKAEILISNYQSTLTLKKKKQITLLIGGEASENGVRKLLVMFLCVIRPNTNKSSTGSGGQTLFSFKL